MSESLRAVQTDFIYIVDYEKSYNNLNINVKP